MWDYHLIEMPPNRTSEDVRANLNELGAERWELVTLYVGNSGNNVFICKRPAEATVKSLPFDPSSLRNQCEGKAFVRRFARPGSRYCRR